MAILGAKFGNFNITKCCQVLPYLATLVSPKLQNGGYQSFQVWQQYESANFGNDIIISNFGNNPELLVLANLYSYF